MSSITIKELHRVTGGTVRRAGAGKVPLIITDHGKPIAVIANPSLLKKRIRRRTLLPEYVALMEKKVGKDAIEDLDAVRGDR